MFDKVKDQFHSGNRGGYKQWFNPVYADPNKNTQMRPTKTTAMLFGDDKDDADDEVLPQEEDDDEAEYEPPTDRNEAARKKNGFRQEHTESERAQQEATRAASRRLSRAPLAMPQGEHEPRKRIKNIGEIQVLGLHSDNPIISYKGRIFSGNWASNIGTELIFGAHDEIAERDLPYLKALPDGVDLMAASSCRIVTTPADLRHKKSIVDGKPKPLVLPYANRRPPPDKYRALRKASNIEIPVAFDKHGRRKPQARFLENLMAIKRKRGEIDEATTMTRDTRVNYVDKNEDPDEASAQKKRMRDRRRQKRLAEERAAKPKKKRRGGNRWMRKKMVTFEDRPGQESSESDDDEGEGSLQLSMLTPKTWEEALKAKEAAKAAKAAEATADGDSGSGGEATAGGADGEDTIMQST